MISGNQASNDGGGVYSSFVGALTVSQSTISGNQAKIGGGIRNDGTLNLSQSTISGNHGINGGGLTNLLGNIIVINSTISQNDADNDGGGIWNVGTANVYNTSILFNGADTDRNGGSAGGVYNNPGAIFNLRNTLVAGNNVANAPTYDDCTGTLNSFGRNLFWEVIGCTVNNVTGSWTTLNSLQTLGLLQNNGGPTWTHALLPGSNAIDGGDPIQGCVDNAASPLQTDQRGAARVVGLGCDLGAFEYGAKVPWLYLPLILR